MKIFSVVILMLLLIAALGVTVYTQYTLMHERTDYESKITELNKTLESQRNDKNTIRDIWENQAALNDDIILQQDKLTAKVATYNQTVKQSLRFVNTVPEILPTISEKKLTIAEFDLLAEQSALETLTQKNSKQKQQNTDQINQLYLNAGEDQKNRANPAGIR